MSERQLFLRAGSATADGFDVAVTPLSAGWDHSSLHVLTLAPGGTHELPAGDHERLVVPLSGGVTVTVAGKSVELNGRDDVFCGPTDLAYTPTGTLVRLESATGGRFAVCGARTDRVLPFRRVAAVEVPVELRGAGRASRLVRNFATADSFEAGAIIACEVVTPGGNWSSYPAHKHDEQTATETQLEEIYYFEIAAGPAGQPGFGYHRTSSSSAGEIDVLAEVHDGDVALVPFGWHGPCVAAPGHDMYYLNVMAGPAAERAWLITDHPDQAWVRSSWHDEQIDPRLKDRR
jgi:5-deoxy-glucuronate isomerase